MKKLFLLVLSACLFSCSTDLKLPEKEAITQIEEVLKDGCYGRVKNGFHFYIGGKAYQSEAAALDKMKEQGLVRLNKEPRLRKEATVGYTYNWWLQENPNDNYVDDSGKNYLMTENIFGEILGISVNQKAKTAVVNYSYEKKATPFWELAKKKHGNGCPTGTLENEATFIYYDTGWKIKK